MPDMSLLRTMTLPERVRARPAVLFGAFGLEGALNALKLLLDLFETEARLGYCDRLTVELHDDNEIVIQCNDRGLLIDDTPVDGAPAWEHAFCRLYPGPRKEDEPYLLQLGAIHNTLYGDWDPSSPVLPTSADHRVDLCCTQCAALSFHAESVRGHVKHSLDFQKGYRTSGPTAEPTTEEDGTLLRFRLDPDVFGSFGFSYEALTSCLLPRFSAAQGLHFAMTDQRTPAVKGGQT